MKFENVSQVEKEFRKSVQPVLKQFCWNCHNSEEMESGIRIDDLNGSLSDRELFRWKEIKRVLTGQSMPPEDEAQLSAKQRNDVAAWIEAATRFANSRPQPKNGSSRRLTVDQYRNTLADLLGIGDDFTSRLPPDAISKDGFVNNEKTMLLSPLLLEAYFEIAELALDRALVNETSRPTIQNFRMDLGRNINPQPYPDKLILGANSRLLENQDFIVTELTPEKPFLFEPFQMQKQFRFIEGYQGNNTVRGWKEFDSIYHAVFACMRGDSGYPKGLGYQLVPQGLLLRPAIPSAELFGVSSTYGPKANFKIAVRELPDQGNFRVRVRAAKYFGGLLLDRNQSAIPVGQKPDVVCNLFTDESVDIPEDGVYQAVIDTSPHTTIKAKPDPSHLDEKLIGRWTFDESFKAWRTKGQEENTKLTGKPLGGIRRIDSPFGQALQLDGKDDSVVIKRDPSMNVGSGEFSVSAWIRPTRLGQSGIVCLGKYSWTHGWYFDMPNGNGVLRLETASADNQSNGTVQSRPGVIRVNQWQHVAAVVNRKENQTRLYVNGYEVARGTIKEKNLDNPNVDLYIGRIQDAHHFQGEIDDVRLYSRALENEEIQALLAGGESFIQPPPPGKPQNMVLGYKLSDPGSERSSTVFKEVAGSLYQPEFALVRLPKGSIQFSTNGDGKENAARISLYRLEKENPWISKFEKVESRNPKLGIYAGLRRDCGHTLAPVGSPREVESTSQQEFVFTGAIANFPSPDIEKNNVNYLAGFREIGIRSEYTDGREMPQLLIESVEFEGPYYEAWPPKSHTDIFIDRRENESELEYGRRVVGHFATRAFRRPMSDEELRSFVNVFEDSFRRTEAFHSSVRDALLVVLTSPQFLFILEKSDSPKAEPITDYELASKLSYFLWNSPPDEKMLRLAEHGKLTGELDSEIQRLVSHPRFERFCNQFTRQWLNLAKLEVVNIDRKKFPRLTRDTKTELGKEPVEYIKYLIRNNRPVRELIESDYILANEVTASFYQLGEAIESGYKFAPLKTDRAELGGLLGQAGILAGLSDGREPNPIKRGAWLARKIIAEPPDDPPPNVPDLEQETENLPLRERLQIHRNQKGCAACHSGIDPWGLPLEQFDASGTFQTKSNPNAKSKLPDQTSVEGFLQLKRYLAEERIDQVVFSFVKHLTTYAIGRSLTYNEVETLKQRSRKWKLRDYRMRELVQLVVESEMFLEK